MRVLLVHNRYRLAGGEDESVRQEIELLKEHGHQTAILAADNRTIGRIGAVLAGASSVWNPVSYLQARRIIRAFRPDVASVHNIVPQLSPSIYFAARAERVPVVQTLHNFRLLCPAATMLRKGAVCESCRGRTFAWPGVAYGCYRGSRLATAAVAWTSAAHALAGTWRHRISVYIALTEFARRQFVRHGLPAERIVVKPNFLLPDPGAGEGGQKILFVGRLAPEKGADTLLKAWRLLGSKVPLQIVGDGPMRAEVEERSREYAAVEYLGWRPVGEVLGLMQRSRLLVMPSLWFEGLPRAVIEAFSTGLPVFASALGSLAELVDDGRTGRLFRPGDPEDLAAKIDWALSHPAELDRMRRQARAEFEAKYTAERNYGLLMEIFHRAIEVEKQ